MVQFYSSKIYSFEYRPEGRRDVGTSLRIENGRKRKRKKEEKEEEVMPPCTN